MSSHEGRRGYWVTRLITQGGSKDWRTEFFQHLITGAIATAAHYVVMWAALSIQLVPALATTIGFLAGATTRFLFSYFHIFEPERNVINALPHFMLALTLQMIVNAGLLTLLLSANLPVWPSQVLVTGSLTVFNFLAYKFWVFK